ncbi:MAG: aminodeoxychorismate/anthranilate synthase component II [Cytophagales bacterium]|nr:aminodeoxychorismate/anthranilate synthase component II [Cytophagales bacterium]
MRRVLVLDNYDSFTYNLVHILRELGLSDQMEVHRNDKISLDAVDQFDDILLSPGPGVPQDAGIMPELIKRYAPTKNILGVCLGHQAIGEAFGATLYNLPLVYHGVTTEVEIDAAGDVLFEDIPEKFTVCRYHSWVIEPDSLPANLKITVRGEEGRIMGLAHKQYNVRGVQFHPESIMTEHGKKMIENWLKQG